MDPDSLRWVKQLRIIVPDGPTYAGNACDASRYEMTRSYFALPALREVDTGRSVPGERSVVNREQRTASSALGPRGGALTS